MKKKLFALIMTGVLAASLAACGSSSSNATSQEGSDTKTESKKELTKITFALDWTPNTNHTGLYVADALGYFEDAGIDIEFVQTSSGYGSELVGVGKAEFGIDFQDTLAYTYASDDPIPVTAVAAVIQHNTSGIITRAESNATSPKGLEGLHYATWEDPMEQTLLQYCVEKDGGNWDKVVLDPVTVDDAVAGLQSNIDAVWIYYAWDGIRAQLSDLDTNFFFLRDYCEEMDEYTPVIIGNDDYMKENPEITKAFVAAVRKGYEYAVEHPEDAAKILCEEVPELDEELVTTSQKWLADQYVSDAPYWGYIDASRWDGVYSWMYDNELLEGKIEAGTGFTNDYNPE